MLIIFYEWKNSLALLKKDTLLLLLYSWYKLTMQVYKDLLFYFWWLILPFIALVLLQNSLDLNLIIAMLNTLLFYITLLLSRPSLEKKDHKYVLSKGLGYTVPLIFTLILYILSFLNIALFFLMCFMPFKRLDLEIWLPNFLPSFLLLFPVAQWIFFFLSTWIFLFLLDSKGSFKDCFRAVWCGYKMTLFNLPIVIILAGFLKACQYTHALIHTYLPDAFQMPSYHVMLYPLIITLITIIYIKRVHDQCSLFFGRSIA